MNNQQSTAVSAPAHVETQPINPPLDTDQVFSAMETFIKQRPGLDPADYGLGRGQTPDRKQWWEAHRAYRAEVRQIGKDRQRAMKALDEARGLQPANGELLRDAFRAFSGRLEWLKQCKYCGYRADLAPSSDHCPKKPEHVYEFIGRLGYTTGQYFPTEYRKAAASVLESYIAAWHREYASEHPQEFIYRTMADVKAANRQIGAHWFDRDTIRFFNTRIESGLIGGKYFITSECMLRDPSPYDNSHPRRFSVRRADPDGTIDTVGEFQGHSCVETARLALKLHMGKVNERKIV